MRKNVFLFGAIAGLISISWGLFACAGNIGFENGELYGYAVMLLAFSMIFVSIKNFRDKKNGGAITFGKAFRMGLGMTLVASTVYVVIWLIYYYSSGTNFFGEYMAYYTKELKESGASEAMIESQMAEMKKFAEMYKNPLFNALFTYMEILPVGLLVSLLAAAIMRRKPKNPDGAILDQQL